LGFCDTVLHKLFMKTEEPVYVKQFKIPEAHQSYLQEQVWEWMRLGIIQPSRSRYNSPVFLVQKKDGTHQVVQDFRSLNANTYVDKYSMKDVQECTSEIGRAGLTDHLYYFGPYIGILVNGTRPKVTALHHFYCTRHRTV
jgi:hypothetical protein